VPVRITTLGGISIHAQGRDLPRLSAERWRWAILVYLAVERDVSRAGLLELLWPRREPGRARRSLNRYVRDLNRTLGRRCIEIHGDRLRTTAAVELDVHAFEMAATIGARERALELYGGPFLDGFALPASPGFEHWMLSRRAMLAELHDRIRAAPAETPIDVAAWRPRGRPSAAVEASAATEASAAIDASAATDSSAAATGQKSYPMRVLSELQRRRVFRVAVAYATVAFIVIQGVPPVFDALRIPDWATSLVIVLLLAAFPFALVLAWAFELTPEGELRRELPAPDGASLSWRGFSPRRLVIGGLLMIAFATAAVWAGDRLPQLWPAADTDAAELEDGRYVILPLQRDAGVDATTQDEVRLHDALALWSGIEVVDLSLAQESLGQGAAAPSRGEAQHISRSLGAGRFLSGDVSRLGGWTWLRIRLHDTATGAVLASAVEQYADSVAPADSLYDRVVTALLLQSAGIPELAGADPGTRWFPALLVFQRGMDAVLDWDLAAADDAFSAALDIDADFARAALWRAQVQNWTGRAPRDLRPLAERAAAHGARLTARERLLARALLHLADAEFASACGLYDELTRTDERDFAAWYGLAECRIRDDLVVPDASSPSGWAFRSSYHQAIESLARAFNLLPSVHRAFRTPMAERARQALHTGSSRISTGRAEQHAGVFLARPVLTGDTLAFTPYPEAVFATGGARAPVAAHARAIERQRRMFHDIAAAWASSFPDSPDALEALSLARELVGNADALYTLRQARSLALDSVRLARFAAAEVGLLIKFGTPDRLGDLERARTLADSLLTAAGHVADEHAHAFSVTAALIGRVHRAAALARQAARPESWRVDLPVSVTAPWKALLTYAAAGAPGDSIAAYEEQLAVAIRNFVPGDHQLAASNFLLAQAASLAYPHQALARAQQLAASSNYELLQAQAALARGDSAAARDLLVRIAEMRRPARPAERSIDALFPEAWLRAALGDTVTATAALDSTLSAIRWMEPGSYTYRAASLIHAMALLADFAAAAADTTTAARWAAPVATLWADADEELQPLVVRMRALVAAQGRREELHSVPPPRGGRR
jgi:hypothetical protein